jgi:hypothetical protein
MTARGKVIVALAAVAAILIWGFNNNWGFIEEGPAAKNYKTPDRYKQYGNYEEYAPVGNP